MPARSVDAAELRLLLDSDFFDACLGAVGQMRNGADPSDLHMYAEPSTTSVIGSPTS